MSTDSSSDRDPVERLAEEFLERRRHGKGASLDEYAERYPEWAERIREVFPALEMMERLKPASGDRTGSFDDDGGVGEGHRAPERLGDYRILREVGRGGMGVVYEAVQESLGRHVALKLLPMHGRLDPVHMERFRLEARSAAKLHHTHIVPVHGVGQHDGVPYYTMQFIQGCGLDAVINDLRRLRHVAPAAPAAASVDVSTAVDATRSRAAAERLLSGRSGGIRVERPTPEGRLDARSSESSADRSGLSGQGEPGYHQSVARIGVQVAEALAHAHGQGVLHRDIKPSNLLLDADGEVWVTDFGLAKAVGADDLTHTGDIVGTVRYMAPERFEGWSDPRSDVYALGLTLYELLALRPAFDESDRGSLIRQVTQEDAPRLRMLNRKVPIDLETIVHKAMAREPGHRYATAGALAEDLNRFIEGRPVLARRVSSAELFWRWSKRNPWLAGLSAALLLALVSGTVVASLLAARATREARRANNLADEREKSLRESNRRLALLNYELGQNACEKGEIGPGMLLTIESWRSADRAGNAAWQHAARTNLAAWQSQYPALMGVFSHSKALSLRGAVSFSSDGKTALTASLDQTAQLWDLATGQPIGPPLRHQGPVLCAALSPDGKTALTGSTREDTTARFWDLATGQPIGSPVTHRGAVWFVAFSPDGKAALTAGVDGTARLWDVATGMPRREFKHGDSVRSVAFSPDSKTALTASFDKTARLWDLATGQQIGSPLPHLHRVEAVAFSPKGKTVLTGSDKTAQLWDTATGQPIGPPLTHEWPVKVVAFSPDGEMILTASSKGARLWNAATGQQIGSPLQHLDEVVAVAFSRDGKTVLTGSWDKTARLWDAATGQPIGAPLQHQGPICGVAISPDGKTALTGSQDRSARLWDISTKSRGSILRHDTAVGSVAFSPDGKTVLSTSWDGTIRIWLWDTTGRSKGSPARLRVGAMTSVRALSPDGKTVLTGSRDGTAQFWDAATGKPIGPPLPHERTIMGVAFSPNGTIALTACGDKAQLWDVATGTTRGEPLKHPEQVASVALSADGKTVLTGCWDGMARLWDAATGKPIGPPLPHQGLVFAVALSPDGKTALTGSADNTARLWDVATGMPRGTLMLHRGGVFAVALSPDGKTALTGSGDNTARLWDVATGMPRGAPLPHQGVVISVEFSPDGKTALTGSEDGTARLWPTADLPDDLPRIATWVESLTGLTLDASGSIQPLDRDAWLERREKVKQQGGSPVADAVR
jgi:WD40 repeat protein/serine/threonine protein kinase